MRARVMLMSSSLICAAALSGCITERAVLTNAQGQTVTCQATGHVGIVSPIRVYAQQHHCVKEAEANGYKKTAAPAGHIRVLSRSIGGERPSVAHGLPAAPRIDDGFLIG